MAHFFFKKNELKKIFRISLDRVFRLNGLLSFEDSNLENSNERLF